MADITVTPANVAPTTTTVPYQGTSGEAITAGQDCYLDPTTNTVKKAVNTAATAAANIKGVALNSTPGSGQPITLAVGGHYNPGATVVPGTVYCLSATAGGICPVADLASGHVTSVLGVATAANDILLGIINSGTVN